MKDNNTDDIVNLCARLQGYVVRQFKSRVAAQGETMTDALFKMVTNYLRHNGGFETAAGETEELPDYREQAGGGAA